jgi:phosphate:Na+ symporter
MHNGWDFYFLPFGYETGVHLNSLSLIGGLAGGIGLFLLGMGLMTDGLKLAAGPALERIIASSTQTRIRGLASGMLVTALVQSSSAVTVAAIGFVNAGLLSLSQALWVLFGANVGTTMTGWLVALVSMKFKIEALALPLIGLGMILRLTGEGERRGAAGMAIAGFGVLFLGIDLLKEAFSGLSTDFSLPQDQGVIDTFQQVGIGIVLTVLMQSSSAALAVALTAAQGGLLTAHGAAAVVIGANIGTTATALIAAMGATSSAKRAAGAHIFFNLLTGLVALLLLPWLVDFLALLRDGLGMEAAPAAELALFHTVFNIMGVILIWPIADRVTRFLEARFKTAEEDEGKPRHLDKTVQAVPAMGLEALEREVRHMGGIAIATAKAAIADSRDPALARNKIIVARLAKAIAEFIVQINRSGMAQHQAEKLSRVLRQARYYEAAAELAFESAAARNEPAYPSTPELPDTEQFLAEARLLLSLCDEMATTGQSASLHEVQQDAEHAYQAMKARLLQLGVEGHLTVAGMDTQLRRASLLHRALHQISKASALLPQARPEE